MFDHLVVSVSDLPRSVEFYRQALRPLGFKSFVDYPGHPGHAALQGFGNDREEYLLLKKGKPGPAAVHVALRAKSKKVVDAFHTAALAAGGRDNGPPGPRVHYFPGYYAAYVLDPDGYNIEAVYQST
jgi:catechol 2,3-dioxygenase-like lactoylglutathione lyase family enzyme